MSSNKLTNLAENPKKIEMLHFASLKKNPIVASQTLRQRQTKRLDKEMSFLANKNNIKSIEDQALESIKKQMEKRDKKFEEQMLINQENRMIKQMQKQMKLKKVIDNQKRISASRRDIKRPISPLQPLDDSIQKPQKSFMHSTRNIPDKTIEDSRSSIEHVLEEFDQKHTNALSHKIKHHIDVVSSIAKHNSLKEQKAKEAEILRQKQIEKKTLE